jgi:pyruvate dehydrogenase E1 component
VESGAYIREHFFGPDPRLRELVAHLPDEALRGLRRGGHDYRKLHAAYRVAVEHRGAPTVILAKTVKGWTLGDSTEGRNITHQVKHLSLTDLKHFRDRLELPIPDSSLDDPPYYRPGPKSEEIEYLFERRRELGGSVPRRIAKPKPLALPDESVYAELFEGTEPAKATEGGGANTKEAQPKESSAAREASTTMAFVRLLRAFLRDPVIGKRVVPIIPDEARTFGMDALFREVKIYSSVGQLYEPVDSKLLLRYAEAKDGQILEEGISEAGSMASFTAAGTSYATHGEFTIPFYIFYSMFGFQRIGDFAWAFGDSRGRGFMLGATAGRTTLNGEGLQHQDGHSHILASTIPSCVAYDPAWSYEMAILVREGLRRMIAAGEDVFYYLTLYNENYAQPAMPQGCEEGILRGLYRYRSAEALGAATAGSRKGAAAKPLDATSRPQLFGSGPILRSALAAQEMLAADFGIASDVWSATSYTELAREARSAERWSRMHPERPPRVPYVVSALGNAAGPVIAATDYVSAVPDQIARWIGRRFVPLGTDGFGRSDTRASLRRHFEVDAASIVVSTLYALSKTGAVDPAAVTKAMRAFEIDPDSLDPFLA